MSRVRATVILFMVLIFVTTLIAGQGASQEPGKGQMRMKGMKSGAMMAEPVGPCMKPMGVRPTSLVKGKVAILKPQNGVVIKSRTVKIEFDFPQLGHGGNHLHIYLDGLCKNMIRSGKSYYLSGLTEGKHKIELRIVTSDHFEVGPSAGVEISVNFK